MNFPILITMYRRRMVLCVVAVLALVGLSGAAVNAQEQQPFDPDSFNLGLELVAEGFNRPVQYLESPDESGRMFVVEQSGTVRIIAGGELLAEPFLDISGQISSDNEQGLLSIAFHPGFAENQTFFIDYTDLDGNTRIERWTVDPADINRADPGTAQTILQVEQPAPNHNGGLLLFDPDGYLYIGLGDGGSQGDPDGNGQNTETLLGSILRIDVDSTSGDQPYGIPADNPFANAEGGRPEIWAYGFRNPWRFSFDRETGDLFIGDVGQGDFEEVSLLPSGSGDRNFGWNIMEGDSCYRTDDCDQTGLVPPIFAYSHNESGCSVVGGYVYRGEEIESLVGVYMTADYCTGQLWGIGLDADGNWIASNPLETGLNVSSFSEDNAGNLFIIDLNGSIYQIVATA